MIRGADGRGWRDPAWTGLVLGLVLVLGFFAAATAVHSVHHIGDADSGASCPVLSGSHHLPGVATAPPDFRAPVAAVVPVAAGTRESVVSARVSRPDAGRAPPAASSV